MKYNILIITAIATLFLISCEKEITVPQPDYVQKTSIQGILEPDSLPLVFFNKTTPFLSSTTTTGQLVIRNATVRITGGNTTDVLKLDSLYDRIYCQFSYFYKGTKKTLWNTAYTLDIVNGTATYTASTITTLQKAVIDSVRYTATFNDVYGEHEGVIVYFKDIAGSTNYYRNEQARPVDTTMKHASIKLSFTNGCIGRDTIQTLEQGRSVYNDQNVDGQQIKIVIEPAFTHREGLKSTVKIQTIDKAMYDFYDQIDKQKLAQYNPFVEPIFLKEGQFGSKAIGFFGCRTRSLGVGFVFPE
jgi:Domain of unknown function (DUF4249)